MSIIDEMLNRQADGRLKKFRPRVTSDPVIRSLYLEENLHSELYLERDNITELEMFADLEADLETFVVSQTLDPDYLKLLKPRRGGIWEIRSTRPDPQIRVFGAFAAKNYFIATHYQTRDYLGDLDSREWKEEIRRVKCIWRNLFPGGYNHMTSQNPNNLFTGAINAKYYDD